MRNIWQKSEVKVETETEKKTIKSMLRTAGLIAVVILILVAIVASFSRKTPNSDKVWYPEMTMGNMEAENYFIIYSDLACPYCLAFENAMIEHKEALEEYIEKNDILIEVRAADFLYNYGEGHSIESRYSAVATYCAKDEGKFWDYYDLAVTKVWNEYFKEGGKAVYNEFNKLGQDYWINIGKSVGLSDEFETCVKEEKTLAAVTEDAEKMAKYASGLPYFKFNKEVFSGFSLEAGWDYVLMYFEAGLKNK